MVYVHFHPLGNWLLAPKVGETHRILDLRWAFVSKIWRNWTCLKWKLGRLSVGGWRMGNRNDGRKRLKGSRAVALRCSAVVVDAVPWWVGTGEEERDRSERRRGEGGREGSGRGFCLMGRCFCFMQHLALPAQPHHHHGKIAGCRRRSENLSGRHGFSIVLPPLFHELCRYKK